MKIVSTRLRERYDGVLDTFAEFVDQVILWEPDIRPITDVIDICKPNFIFCDIKHVNNFFIKICNEYKDAKIVLFSEMVPRGLNPYLICSEPNITPLLKKHLENNNRVIYLHDFANTFLFKKRETGFHLESDISYYSNYNIYSMPEEKLRLFAKLSNSRFKVKIAGPSKLILPNYLGNIDVLNVVNFWKGSKIAIDWHNKNLLDLAANRIFTLSSHPNKLFPLLKDDPRELNEQLSSFIENGKARRKIAKKAQMDVFSCDTVYHRVLQIAENFENSEDLVQKIKTRIEEVNKCAEE